MNPIQMFSNFNDLSREAMRGVTRDLLSGDRSDSEIAATLISLKMKGETVDEIAGIVDEMRAHTKSIPTALSGIMDNCGTGGDGLKTFNISTTTAFVLAGAGVPMAKHGNRSVSSQTGSADVLEYLGVALDFNEYEVAELLETVGIAFLFAPHIHFKLKPIMTVRKSLRVPTIFNLIGPLTNPVSLDYQFLGIYDEQKLDIMAEALHQLGRQRAIVVTGKYGMDEANLAGTTQYVLMDRGKITRHIITPAAVNLPTYPLSHIQGGDAARNAEILSDVLDGKHGAHRDTVLLNASLALLAAGRTDSPLDGIKLAEASIDTGRAKQALTQLQQYSSRRDQKTVTS